MRHRIRVLVPLDFRGYVLATSGMLIPFVFGCSCVEGFRL